jgi:hypothetical protein
MKSNGGKKKPLILIRGTKNEDIQKLVLPTSRRSGRKGMEDASKRIRSIDKSVNSVTIRHHPSPSVSHNYTH